MKNPYSSNENPFLVLWAIGTIAKEAGIGLGEDLAAGIQDPGQALRRRAKKLKDQPAQWIEEWNDRITTNRLYRSLQHRLADRVGEWLGPEERQRVDLLLGGTLAQRRRALAKASEDIREAIAQAGQDWRKSLDEQTEQFFRLLGSGLDRQVRVIKAYQTLGLKQGAGMDSVKERHRKLSIRYHPDKPGGHLGKMQEVNEAYTVLMKYEFGKGARYGRERESA